MYQETTWYAGRPQPRRHCVRWGRSSPSPKWAQPLTPPQFTANVRCGQPTGWMKTPLCTEIDLGAGHIVLDGDPARPRERAQQPPSFRPMSIVATVAHLSYCWALVCIPDDRVAVASAGPYAKVICTSLRRLCRIFYSAFYLTHSAIPHITNDPQH